MAFLKNSSELLETSKNVVWQSSDGRVISDHCRVTVQRLFSKNCPNCLKRRKALFDSRPTVAWPPTTDAWPFCDFFQNFYDLVKTSKKRCLTVGRWSRDLRPLSRDRSVTFFKFFSNRSKRLKNLVWQSSDGRVTSDHCRVTFSDFFQNFSELLETSKIRCSTVIQQTRDLRSLSRDLQWLFSKNFRIAWNV